MYSTSASLSLSAIGFIVIDSVCLKFEIENCVTRGTSLTTTRLLLFHCTKMRETCIPTQGKCWCVNSLLKYLQQLIRYSIVTADRSLAVWCFFLFLFVYFFLKSINKQPVFFFFRLDSEDKIHISTLRPIPALSVSCKTLQTPENHQSPKMLLSEHLKGMWRWMETGGEMKWCKEGIQEGEDFGFSFIKIQSNNPSR